MSRVDSDFSLSDSRSKKMSRLKILAFPIAVVASVLAAVGAGAVWASGNDGSASLVPQAISCSAAPVPPADAELNTILDKEHGLLTYSFYDASLGADRTATIDYKSAACNGVAQLARMIAHVRDTDAEAQAQNCAATRKLIADNVTTLRGRPINLDAARKYVSTWC
jgi:hypothetical protein